MKFNRFSSITEASEPKKLKRGDRFEDRILVSKRKGGMEAEDALSG
jgi:hypothetical protein